MTGARTLLFAVAGGAAVGNLYWAQPLLEEIAASLGVPPSVAGLLVTVTQIGYAVGIFLLVPLGDLLNRRRLIPVVLAASGLALAGAAVAPSWVVLFAALLLVGLTAVGAQLLIPLASELADPAERGRVVGTIASGVLIGILLSRTISGLRRRPVRLAGHLRARRRRRLGPRDRAGAGASPPFRPGRPCPTRRCCGRCSGRSAATGPCRSPWSSAPPPSAPSPCSGPR